MGRLGGCGTIEAGTAPHKTWLSLSHEAEEVHCRWFYVCVEPNSSNVVSLRTQLLALKVQAGEDEPFDQQCGEF